MRNGELLAETADDLAFRFHDPQIDLRQVLRGAGRQRVAMSSVTSARVRPAMRWIPGGCFNLLVIARLEVKIVAKVIGRPGNEVTVGVMVQLTGSLQMWRSLFALCDAKHAGPGSALGGIRTRLRHVLRCWSPWRSRGRVVPVEPRTDSPPQRPKRPDRCHQLSSLMDDPAFLAAVLPINSGVTEATQMPLMSGSARCYSVEASVAIPCPDL